MGDQPKKLRGPILALYESARFRRRVLLALFAVPVLYFASFGPACWMAAAPRIPGTADAPRFWMRLYYPIGALIHRTQSQDNRYWRGWITWGAGKGGRVIVPTDAGGMNWYGFTAD